MHLNGNGTIDNVFIKPNDLLLKREPASVDVVPLPDSVQFPAELAAKACPWLDEYVAFSRKWSPRAHDDFHESVGVWLLSTVAARRVYCELGGKRYTNLYIALASRTSVFAKSTTAKIGIELLKTAGLKHLLAADEATPQKFIKDMTYTVPENWGQMSDTEKDAYIDRMTFAGQRGWYYDEFGQKISGMMRENGFMSEFRGLLRRFDLNENDYRYGTIGRGEDIVHAPYLALLANLTPADLKPFAKRGGALWSDGFWARFAFVTPPELAPRKNNRFPAEKKVDPASLLVPLRDWHERLGYTTPRITERGGGDSGRKTYTIAAVPPPEREVELGKGVFNAFYDYDNALGEIITSRPATDIDGNYSRFAEKAIRIAVLLASFDGGDLIEMRHWARAQQITEMWRCNLHNLYSQVTNTTDGTTQIDFEDRIMQRIVSNGPQTRRQMMQYINGLDSDTVNRVTESMLKAGVLVSLKNGKKEEFALAVEASVGASHQNSSQNGSSAYENGVVEIYEENSDATYTSTQPSVGVGGVVTNIND